MSPSLTSQFRNSHWYGVGKSEIALGPWTGGLNLIEDTRYLKPNELKECINFIIKPSGRLIPRPNVTKNYVGLPSSLAYIKLLGAVDTTVSSDTGVPKTIPIVLTDDGTNARLWQWNDSLSQWAEAFGTATTPVPGTAPRFRKMHVYNNLYYFVGTFGTADPVLRLSKSTGFTSSPTNVVDFATLVGVSSISVGTLWAGSEIVKDRLVVIASNGTILWSKATDFDTWSAPNGGYVKINNAVLGAVLYNDAIYVVGENGVWRFSWVTDPSIDGQLEQLLSTGVFGIAAANSELYVATEMGVFTFNNGYLSELSQKIKPAYIADVNSVPQEMYARGLTLLDNYLLVGPFQNRGSDRGSGNTSKYYVLDTTTGVWVTWEFNDTHSLPGPVGNQEPTISGLLGSIGGNKYFFDGSSNSIAYSGVGYINIDALHGNATPNALDTTDTNSYYIWQKFTTAELDFGQNSRFKRFFKGILEAAYNSIVVAGYAGATFNMLIDGVALALTPPDIGKLAFGKSFRFKRIAFQYTNLALPTGAQAAITSKSFEVTDIDKIYFYVSTSREVTT